MYECVSRMLWWWVRMLHVCSRIHMISKSNESKSNSEDIFIGDGLDALIFINSLKIQELMWISSLYNFPSVLLQPSGDAVFSPNGGNIVSYSYLSTTLNDRRRRMLSVLNTKDEVETDAISSTQPLCSLCYYTPPQLYHSQQHAALTPFTQTSFYYVYALKRQCCFQYWENVPS